MKARKTKHTAESYFQQYKHRQTLNFLWRVARMRRRERLAT